jgi:16S rRNA (uracil1498-N3)-methyltransferase
MAERFHLAATDLRTGVLASLDREESHHLLRVMRARPGHVLRVFGAGRDHEAVLVENRGGIAIVEVGREMPSVSPPSVELVFVVPWLKGGRTESVVKKLTELGVSKIIVYAARREVAHGDDAKLARLERVALEACKQCGRSDVPALKCAGDLATALAAGNVSPECSLLLYENETGCLLSSAVRRVFSSQERASDTSFCRALLVASGPEGGLRADEIEAIRDRATVVGLGPRTLRAETAPVAACAAILALCGDF